MTTDQVGDAVSNEEHDRTARVNRCINTLRDIAFEFEYLCDGKDQVVTWKLRWIANTVAEQTGDVRQLWRDCICTLEGAALFNQRAERILKELTSLGKELEAIYL